jgi:hypothetical protein
VPTYTVPVTLALVATVALLVIVSLLGRLQRTLVRRAEAMVSRQLQRLPRGTVATVAASRLLPVIDRTVTTGVVLVGLVVGYMWLTFVLRRFPYTRPLGESLRELLLTRLIILGDRIIAAMPDVIMVALIVVITRFGVKLSNGLFDAVASGRIRTSPVYAETAPSTKRIAAALLCAFALIQAYPYLPGSGTDAFKGVSVFVSGRPAS